VFGYGFVDFTVNALSYLHHVGHEELHLFKFWWWLELPSQLSLALA
jgi:hypothetical protein